MREQRFVMRASLLACVGLALVGCASTGPECGAGSCGSKTAAIPGNVTMDGGRPAYRVDIKVPPGRNGMAPSLSIAYSAGSGNSALGFGWSLQGYSSIHRCPATELRDGYEAGVRYAPADRLCMDGERLVPLSGQYGRSGTLYRTQLDSFVQVHEVGDMDDPVSYFVATFEDGTKRYYKDVQIHRGVKAPVAWFTSYMEDIAGNAITYSYDRSSPGVLLLSEVRYTGRDGPGGLQPGTRWVRFDYEPRPDVFGTYLAGGQGFFDKRLRSIRTGLDSQDGDTRKPEEILRYEFSYTQSPGTGRSLVTKLRECARGARGKLSCLAPTTFDWTSPQVKYQDPVAYDIPASSGDAAPEWHAHLPPVGSSPYSVSHDYNADGRDDILFYRKGAAPHLYTVDIRGKFTKDIDLGGYVHDPGAQWVKAMGWDIRNNGGADVIGDLDGKLSVAVWEGAGIGPAEATDIPYSDDMLIGDYDGSSQADVVESHLEGHDYVVSVYLNGGSTPARLIYGKPIEVLRLPVPADSSSGGAYRLATAGDLDGNGAVDALVMQGDVIRKIIFFYQRSDGSLRSQAVDPSDYGISDRAQQAGIHFADINSDGLMDIVYLDDSGGTTYTWRYQVNTGDGFAPPVDTGIVDAHLQLAGTSALTADLYMDGRDELIFPDELLVPYCLPAGNAHDAAGYQCSDTGLEQGAPQSDFGIYRYAALKFDMTPVGSLTAKLVTDTGIVAQANLASVGDLQGDDDAYILSPFSPWFSNGRFRDKSGRLDACPESYGCGLRVAAPGGASRDDRRDAAPDMAAKIDHGDGRWESWHYYPLSNPVRALYSVPPIDSKDRFIDPYNYFFTSSMYVAGELTQYADGEQTVKFGYGGGVYGTDNMAFQGFRWMIEDDPTEKVRYVDWYEQAFPYWGQLRSSWTEPDSAGGDDYVHGIPSQRYFTYTAYGLDCQGPAGTKYSLRAGCVDSGTPTYYARRRSMTVSERNLATGARMVKQSELYDYDLFGHQTRSQVRNVDGSVTTIDYRYASPDGDDWWSGETEEKQTAEPAASKSDMPPSGSDDVDDADAAAQVSDTLYDYDAMHFLKSMTRSSSTYDEKVVDLYTYYTDAGSPNFGNKRTETREYVRLDGQIVPGYVRTFEYTGDGYFLSSMSDSGNGKTTYVYDPATGNMLSETRPDGSSTTYSYDEFGNKQ